ncbi:MAG: RraA family protein [Candidatus Aminicenantaceae bacterium]
MDFQSIKAKLQMLDTACVCDADKNLRVLDPGIRPLLPNLQMIGMASTVRCRGDFLSVIKALDEARENDVLIIDGGGEKIALSGELFSYEAKRKGLAGIVVDGACRDSSKIRKLRFPFYSRSITPMAGTASTIFATQIDVVCGSVRILPGDIIFGDSDGVVVINPGEVEDILYSAAQIQLTEEKVLAQLERGKSLLSLLNYREHYQKVGRGEESKLTFLV